MTGSYKILFKRLEDHDSRFRQLLHDLFGQVRYQLRRCGYCDEVVRLKSSIFVNAPCTMTPFDDGKGVLATISRGDAARVRFGLRKI
jgi:hypothetical protein